jgi:hypothetical protein
MKCDYCGSNDMKNNVSCLKCSRNYCNKCKNDALPNGVETIEMIEVTENVVEERRHQNNCFKCLPKRLYAKCNKCNKLHEIKNIQEKCYICNRKYCIQCKNTEKHGLGICVIIEEEQ